MFQTSSPGRIQLRCTDLETRISGSHSRGFASTRWSRAYSSKSTPMLFWICMPSPISSIDPHPWETVAHVLRNLQKCNSRKCMVCKIHQSVQVSLSVCFVLLQNPTFQSYCFHFHFHFGALFTPELQGEFHVLVSWEERCQKANLLIELFLPFSQNNGITDFITTYIYLGIADARYIWWCNF